MLAIIVHFEAKPDKIEAFKEAIVGHATRCLEREPGCLQFDVVQYRLKAEYGADSRLEVTRWSLMRWIDPSVPKDCATIDG